MFLMTVAPRVSGLLDVFILGLRRCYDRHYTCDERRTRTLVQEDYERINTDSEFRLEIRYSNLLTVLAVTFFYSGGMPILYLVATLFFLFNYWMDKCMLFNCYRRPVSFDNYLAKKTSEYFKYFFMLHIIGFLMLYGMTPILQNDLF